MGNEGIDNKADMRWEHQPLPHPAERPLPSADELTRTCGKTAALVLAVECDATPLRVLFDGEEEKPFTCEDDETPRPLQKYKGTPVVLRAIELARESKLASVSVLVGGVPATQRRINNVIEEAAGKAGKADAAGTVGAPNASVTTTAANKVAAPTEPAASNATSKADTAVAADAIAAPVHLLSYDRAHDRQATTEACGFALFDYTIDILNAARTCLRNTPDATSVVLLACDEVRITPSHVLEVCSAFAENPDLDVITSWITWESREPALISRRFLESLETSPLLKARPGSFDRPVPSIAARQVVFGEEKLAANAVKPKDIEEFLHERTLSAREAVRIAREEFANEGASGEGEDASGRGEGTSDRGGDDKEAQAVPKKPERSKADRLLVDTARATIERLEARLGSDKREELARADVWAQRNRLDFPLLNDRAHAKTLAYLDSTATSQRVFSALQAQADFDEHENANVYRGSYELSTQATLTLNDARKTLEDFIGSKRRHTVYTANASASCNLVAQAWGTRNVGEGDLIVVTLAEHHSNLLPWQMLAQHKGARLAVVPLLPTGKLDLAVYEKLLSEKPKIVCAAHLTNVLGITNPVQDMARAAHAAGARFFLDAAQSFAHLPVNVKELGADFVAFSAHKAYGPLGIGGLWISDEAFDEMDPVSIGGGSISHASLDSYYLRVGAIQYEVGTPPVSQAVGWAGAISYVETLGLNAIARHGRALTHYLVEGLHDIENVTVWGDHESEEGQNGLVSFSVAGVSSLDLGAFCGKLDVAIRAGSHCAIPLVTTMGVKGTGRASFGVHTTKEDVEALLVAVNVCERLYWERA